MICPTCANKLRELKYNDQIIDACSKCKGIWFDPTEMETVIDYVIVDEFTNQQKMSFGKEIDINNLPYEDGERFCPRCNHSMKKINFGNDSNVIIDRCNNCHGSWLDGGEIYALAKYTGETHQEDLDKKRERKYVDSRSQIEKVLDAVDSIPWNSYIWIWAPKIVLPLKDNIHKTRGSLVTVSIITINVLIYLYQTLFIYDYSTYFNTYGFSVEDLYTTGNTYTLITSMFLHGGFLHLFGNMLFLWIFGQAIEEFTGHGKMLALYLLCGLCGGVTFAFTAGNIYAPAIGASGAISGILGGYLCLLPGAKIKLFFVKTIIDMPAYQYLGWWIANQILAVFLLSELGLSNNIAWFAHIGGFIAGLVFMAINRRFQGKSISVEIRE